MIQLLLSFLPLSTTDSFTGMASYTSEAHSEPLIDYSHDKDVSQTGKVSDSEAIALNWTDGKVAGEFLNLVYCP